MKFLVVVVALCVLPHGLALKCYRCEPDYAKMGEIMANETAANATEAEMMKKMNDFLMCKGSSDTIQCPAERDGMPLDVCSSIEVGMSITPPGLNKSLDLKMVMKNCSSSMMCADAAEKMFCDMLKTTLNSTGMITPGECKIDCCKGDLCDASMPKTTPGAPTSATSKPSVAVGALFILLAMALVGAI